MTKKKIICTFEPLVRQTTKATEGLVQQTVWRHAGCILAESFAGI